MSRVTVMVLCGRSPRHLYVANCLCRAANVAAIVQETGRQWTAKKVIRSLHPGNLWRKIWRRILSGHRGIHERERKYFFGNSSPELDRPDLLELVPHINDSRVVDLADRIRPDAIVVFGTSLIRGELLNKGRLGVINLHGGLSPDYRGADCTFWALYNGEPENIGCTLHYIDAGIDTGKVIAHICPEVYEDDDELTLFWRAVTESADALVELLERLDQGQIFGESQSRRGRLYQVKDRRWRDERFVKNRLASGLLRGCNLPRRIKWFGLAAEDIRDSEIR